MSSAFDANLLRDFHAGSVMHLAVVAATITTAAVMTRLGERAISPHSRRRLNDPFIAILYLICLVVFLRDLRPDRLGWFNSLPLHICDITGLMAAVAIHTGWRFARRILHFWGLALSSIAFITPVLKAGPIHSDFWLYWLHHGAIVVAAIYDLSVNRYRPDWSDWRSATLLLAAYTATIAPLDALLGVNYGYLGHTESARQSLITAFGPWPDRVPALWLTAVAAMALLRVHWPISQNARVESDEPQTLLLPTEETLTRNAA